MEWSLFFGSLLDALIGPNLFVPGEPFMLAAGYKLYQGVWLAVVAVFAGGLIGDQASYWIGRRWGRPAQRRLTRWQPKTRRPIARCRRLMARRGNYVLAFSRLLGPVAWVVPFIAGTQQVSWSRFSLFASVGLVLGIGQFVLWGYLGAYGVSALSGWDQVKLFIIEHSYSLAAVAVTLVFALVSWRMGVKRKVLKSFSVLFVSLLVANYVHFFWRADDAVSAPVSQAFDIEQASFKAYPGKSSVYPAQAVNLVYVGESPESLMKKLGWLKNQTFSRDEIEWKDYWRLLKEKTPPVSDLFWQGRVQDMAFQLPGDLLRRNHVRWWKAGYHQGSPVWVGAISFDNGLTLTPYAGILTVLHSISPDVDRQRDELASSLKSTDYVGQLMSVGPHVAMNGRHDYFSDGRTLVIGKAQKLAAVF